MRRWTDREKELLKRRHLTHSTRELVMALAAEGYARTLASVKKKLHELGLTKTLEIPAFSYQVTEFCDAGDPFLFKVESDFRNNHTPYIIATNEKRQQALFRQPLEGNGGLEPDESRWVRQYNPASG